MSQRAKTIIISIFVCVILAGVGVGLYCAWPAIKGTITGNSYYTYEDVQNAYDKGYTNGIKNEEELTTQIGYYKNEVDKYVISLSEAQTKIGNLEKNLQDAINSGNVDKETIVRLNEELKEANDSLKTTSAELETVKSDLEKVTGENSELSKQVSELTSQLSNTQNELEMTINELKTTTSLLDTALTQNELDATTIENLSNQVATLTSQNEGFSNQIIQLSNQVIELEAQLEAYQSSDLENYYKVTFINDNNDATILTSYVVKNNEFKYPPVIENTYDYWFYGWSTEKDGETPFDFENFIVDQDYTFYSILSGNVDLMINGGPYYYHYEDWKTDEDGVKYKGEDEVAVNRYGENLTVRDVISIKNEYVLELIEKGVISFGAPSLDTKLKDLNTQTIGIMYQKDGVQGSYYWSYKVLGLSLIYTQQVNNNLVIFRSVEDISGPITSASMLFDGTILREELNLNSIRDIKLSFTYKGEEIEITKSDINRGEKGSSHGDWAGKMVESVGSSNLTIYVETSDTVYHTLGLVAIDPNLEEPSCNAAPLVGYYEVELSTAAYVSCLEGVKNREFWNIANAVFEPKE